MNHIPNQIPPSYGYYQNQYTNFNPIQQNPYSRGTPSYNPMNYSRSVPMDGLRMPSSRAAGFPSAPYQYQPLTNFAPKAFQKSKLFSAGGLSSTIKTAQKGLNTANQIIPVVNQMRPIFNNARTMFSVAKAVKKMDDMDFSEEIDRSVVVNENSQKETVVEETPIETVIELPEEPTVKLQPSATTKKENLPTIF